MKIISVFSIIIVTTLATSSKNDIKLSKLSKVLSRRRLSVTEVRQIEPNYCGPAIGEAILRYWGFDPMLDTETFQGMLARPEQMATDVNNGTFTADWMNTMNYFIRSRALNNGLQYSQMTLRQQYDNPFQFYNIVFDSLSRNVPVALAFVGTSADFEGLQHGVRAHYIVIVDVSGTADTAIYTYIDPWDGRTRQFDSFYLPTLLSGSQNLESALLAHFDDERLMQEMDTRRDCHPSTALLILCINILLANPGLYSNSKKTKRAAIKSAVCPAITIANPWKNDEDFIKVEFKFLAHNGIQLKITRDTAFALDQFYKDNLSSAFFEYVNSLLSKIPARGTNVKDTDRSQAAQVLIQGFVLFRDKVITLVRTNDKRSIFLRTFRAYSFDETVERLGLEKTLYMDW